MKFEVCLLMFLYSLASSLRRGPHHPHGQSPVEHRHHHYKPRGSEALTADAGLLHDTKHIEEDSQGLTAEDLARMTPEELEFHYFSAHDFDKNSKLDGLELLKAVYHTMEHEEGSGHHDVHTVESDVNMLDNFIGMVDRTLESDDTDGDGFVSYPEYRAARRASADRTPRVVLEH